MLYEKRTSDNNMYFYDAHEKSIELRRNLKRAIERGSTPTGCITKHRLLFWCIIVSSF